MLLHSDSFDGPVVTAARQALDAKDVDLVLPFVPEEGEDEVRSLFDAVMHVRQLGEDGREVADRLFFETVVRLHRAGEGASFAGLKPAVVDLGPVIPLAEKALEQGSVDELGDFLSAVLHDRLRQQLDEVSKLQPQHLPSIGEARRYIQAAFGFQTFSHRLYLAMLASGPCDGPEETKQS